ncbi:MAG: DUF1592 domain-containing protein, partial [Planctomycetaceae bacterium]|nr:DUF1592 domain-containing protein [Planctomycetaceae bacterium]
CSPAFLYLQDSASAISSANDGQLNDFALATRLSYFLTRTAPDEELLMTAAKGTLSTDPAVLTAQVERLLHHPHHQRFVDDFTDAWLNLRDLEFTNPDGALFPEFDRFLQWSMVQETHQFLEALTNENLAITNVVRSDFGMFNNRLGMHYGIDGIEGPELRRVALRADSVRGGFLSQGSVLKVSANGTNTSPVVRGVYVMERILGHQSPPPPAGVPGVEPDIRGASTLREILDRHRSVESCRSCHQVIDPPGFAMESFNPIGGWRDRFRSLGEGERIDTEINGQRVRYRLGPPVDATGVFPDGRTFQGFREFRDLLAEDETTLARAFATKLLIFATGRDMGFSDRAEIDRIVSNTQHSGYGVRDLLHAVVQSEIFRHR